MSMQTHVITGFFPESNFETLENKFSDGEDAQDAVARLIEKSGDFRLVSVVSEQQITDLFMKIQQWKADNHGHV
jgi:hypothetical protein